MISNLGTSIVLKPWSSNNTPPWKSWPLNIGWKDYLHGIAYFQGLLPTTNMSSENQWLEDVFPTEIVPFSETFLRFRWCRCSFLVGYILHDLLTLPNIASATRRSVSKAIFEGADGTHLFHWWGLKACLIWETSRWYTRNGWYVDSCKKTMRVMGL